jgi:hypothetical protein
MHLVSQTALPFQAETFFFLLSTGFLSEKMHVHTLHKDHLHIFQPNSAGISGQTKNVLQTYIDSKQNGSSKVERIFPKIKRET